MAKEEELSKKIAQLQRELSAKKVEFEQLTGVLMMYSQSGGSPSVDDRVKTLEASLKEVNEKYAEASGEVARLQALSGAGGDNGVAGGADPAVVQELEAKLQKAEADNAALAKSLEETRKLGEEAAQVAHQWQAAATRAEADLKAAEEKLQGAGGGGGGADTAALDARIADLEKQLASKEASHKQFIDAVQESEKEANDKIAALEKQLEEAKAGAGAAAGNSGELEARIAELESNLASREKTHQQFVKALQDELEEATARADKAQQADAGATAGAGDAGRVAELEKELENTKTLLANKHEEMQTRLSAKNSKLEDLELQIQTKTEENDSLRAQVKAVAALQADLAEKTAQIEELKKQATEGAAASVDGATELKNRINDLETELENALVAGIERDKAAAERDKLKTEVESLQKKLESAAGESDGKAQELQAKVTELEAEAESLRTQLETLRQEAKGQKAAAAEAEKRVLELEEELEKLKGGAEAEIKLKQRVEELEEEMLGLQSSADTLKFQLQATREQLQQKERDNAELATQVQVNNELVECTDSDLQAKKKKIEELEESLQSLRDVSEARQVAVEQAQSQLAQEQARASQAEARVADAEARIQELQQQMEAKQSEVAEAKDQIERFRDAANMATLNLAALRMETEDGAAVPPPDAARNAPAPSWLTGAPPVEDTVTVTGSSGGDTLPGIRFLLRNILSRTHAEKDDMVELGRRWARLHDGSLSQTLREFSDDGLGQLEPGGYSEERAAFEVACTNLLVFNANFVIGVLDETLKRVTGDSWKYEQSTVKAGQQTIKIWITADEQERARLEEAFKELTPA
ncbi:MAG: coiled-coil domain-containing protein [Candidatus Xenobia bacterium]